MRILLICSANPTVGPARLSLDMKAAFEKAGHEVVLLTKFPIKDRPDINYVVVSERSSLQNKVNDLLFKFRQRKDYYFFYKKETNPPVSTTKVLNAIHGDFDMVYVLFWQGLISFETIDKIHDRYRVPFIFSAVDFSVMTGGCHFVHNCRRYIHECGRCPGCRSCWPWDFTRFNIRYRKAVYDRVKPVILTNSYNRPFFKESTLTKDCSFVNVPAIVNENVFYPRDKVALRVKYQVPDHICRIMFFGCQNLSEKRKGMDLLVVALNKLFSQLGEEERRTTMVVSAGKSDGTISQKIKFMTMDEGYVDFAALAELYSLADVYLSPSVVDAGPMMVSQSLMSGTPVVAFKMGLALDVVEGKGTGYCAKIGDTDDFAKGIRQFLFMENKEEVSSRCRQVGIETSSYGAFIRNIEKAYDLAK